MRTIDADAFKEYITGACEDMKHLFNDNGAVAKLITESFCRDIDEQPTIQPEPHWIPVTERLPETHEPVLVWSNGYICQDSIVCPWDDKIWYRGGKIEDGDYWMPLSELPEPYKGVTE